MVTTDFVLRPTLAQVDIVEQWLITEKNITGHSFHCNWKIILSAFTDNRMAVITVDKIPVGFVIWYYTTKSTATLDIIAIKPNRRNSGLGKKLIIHLVNYFKSTGIIAVDVECISDESEAFGRKLGFTDFPKNLESIYAGTGYKQLFKIVAPSLEQENPSTENETIEIWDDEPYRTKECAAKWIWTLKFKRDSRELEFPIVHPSHYDWRIRWKSGNTVIADDKIKRFSQDIAFGKFVVIKELK